ncbi:techylectin-5A-like [Centruroides vittatus]|uniref:techylectin-5A-like n=1 Tax=Centruroides vittatus TaxID=120091 RepID=UPI00351013C5
MFCSVKDINLNYCISKMRTSIYVFLYAILFWYPEFIFCSTCSENSCTLSNLKMCITNVPDNGGSTRPQQTVNYHLGPRDCSEIRNNGIIKSGVYRIWPLNWQIYGSFLVYCDMETDEGGWTVFQRRGKFNSPKNYFDGTWSDYSVGFGHLMREFWLGNERIFSLTNQGNYSLRIDMKDEEGNEVYALYNDFWIENERQQYRLHVSGYSGNAGDSLSDHNNLLFTAKDRDNDYSQSNCARLYKGAWWYYDCHSSNLNGLYLDGSHKSLGSGVIWYKWKGYYYSIPIVEMKMRRI